MRRNKNSKQVDAKSSLSNHQSLRSGIERWMVGAAVAGVAVALVLGIFNIWTTGRQLQVSREQMAQSRHAEFTDERPWLVATSANFEINNDMHLTGIMIHVKNTGRTPAIKVTMEVASDSSIPLMEHIHISRQEVMSNSSNQQAAVIAPGEDRSLMDLSMSADDGTGKLHKKLAAIAKKMAVGYLRVDGALAYNDINGTEGFTQFCFVLLDGKTKSGCPGNEMK